MENLVTTKLSKKPSGSSKPEIGNDYALAIWDLINRDRTLRGWGAKTLKELKHQILSWYEILQHRKVPVDALPELYRRARDIQIEDQEEGKDPAELTAVLIASCWIGYQEEWRAKAIKSGRILADKAKAACQECYGTGMKEVERNGVKGVTHCRHDNVILEGGK
jgi:hypothetical protein